MIRVGTIGTSWITERFIEACQLTNQYELRAVYSRNAYRAKDIATVYKATYYSDELTLSLIHISEPTRPAA